MLGEVMRHLNSEYAIRFMLCAYLENLHARQMQHTLPAGVGMLPVRDGRDIEARWADLLAASPHGHVRGCSVTAHEAVEVFGAAVARLNALNRSTAPAEVSH